MSLDIILFLLFTQERFTRQQLIRFAARYYKMLNYDFKDLPREELPQYCRKRLTRAGLNYDMIDQLNTDRALRTAWANMDFRKRR